MQCFSGHVEVVWECLIQSESASYFLYHILLVMVEEASVLEMKLGRILKPKPEVS